VVSRDAIRWVDLGPAQPIHEVIALWREALTTPPYAVAADLPARVRELVWAPLRREFPDGTRVVYLSPDLRLSRVPWSALPGDRPDHIVLEEFAVAVVPHGPFLLDQLWPQDPAPRQGQQVLVAGGVSYGDAPPAPPDTPRYRFEAFLAWSGMAEVWRGRDTVLAREVALKVMREQVFGDSGARSRFAEEARHVSRLEQPSIVPVYDLGELPDGRPFFAMKLVHGQTLAALLAARATPAEDLPRWVGVFEQVCAAVAFAHARGLIHRDLKPSNVMLGAFGEVLVLDWGIAKALAARPQPAQLPPAPVPPSPASGGAETGPGGLETLPGQAKGTPAFMAPEQARGEAGRVGKASDVFGLGGILCVTLTGQPPYTRAEEVLAGDVTGALARLDGCGADAALIGLAKACLAPAPEARPADAAEVAGRVRRYRDAVAARQAEAERVLWLSHATREGGEAFPPAALPFLRARRATGRLASSAPASASPSSSPGSPSRACRRAPRPAAVTR
jgi:tRNA A-37 threonylcarbamoyl transferase component Bud32